VQSVSAGTPSTNSHLTVSLTATQANDLLVVSFGGDFNNATFTISDNLSQTYTLAAQYNPGFGHDQTGISYVKTAAGVTSVTATPSVGSNIWLSVTEYKLTGATNPTVDVTAVNDNSGSQANPQTVGPTSSIAATSDLVVTAFENPRGLSSGASFSTPVTGYTADQGGTFAGASSGGAYVTAYNLTPSSGAQSASSNIVTSAGSGWEVVGLIVTFKVTSSANYAITGGTCTTGGTLTNGSSCTIQVKFTPTTTGTLTDTLDIPFTGATGSPLTVPVTGQSNRHKVRKGVNL
jgi:hypothetical protein